MAVDMPKIWTSTIATHRQTVRQVVVDATLELIRQRGVRGVTMSDIAAAAGIGRATLYKYFADVESIVAAWHAREVHKHLALLREVAEGTADPLQRVEAVVTAYANIVWRSRPHRRSRLAAGLHDRSATTDAERQLHAIVAGCITSAAAGGSVRNDVPPGELATYIIRSLDAAGDAPSRDAVARLISVTMAGLARRS